MNIKKTKHTFFHKKLVKDEIPLKLPDHHISNKNIERKSSIKFLGVMLDKHITCKMSKKKLAGNISLLYGVRQLAVKESLKTITLSHIHFYLNYANIAWASVPILTNQRQYTISQNMRRKLSLMKMF